MESKGIMTVEFVDNGVIISNNYDHFYQCSVAYQEDRINEIGDMFVGDIEHFKENNDCDKVKITYEIEAL